MKFSNTRILKTTVQALLIAGMSLYASATLSMVRQDSNKNFSWELKEYGEVFRFPINETHRFYIYVKPRLAKNNQPSDPIILLCGQHKPLHVEAGDYGLCEKPIGAKAFFYSDEYENGSEGEIHYIKD